jgi:hypothetical protein
MRLSHKLMLAVAVAVASPSLAQNNAAAPANTAENTVTTTDVNATTTTEANVAAPAEATTEAPATTETTTTTTSQPAEKKFPWGVIGLVGLIGLLGMRRRT